MSKAILIMDMPEECAKCELYDHEYDVCIPTGKNVRTFGKPNWCPLKPMPEKQEYSSIDDEFQRGGKIGFNRCINKILSN